MRTHRRNVVVVVGAAVLLLWPVICLSYLLRRLHLPDSTVVPILFAPYASLGAFLMVLGLRRRPASWGELAAGVVVLLCSGYAGVTIWRLASDNEAYGQCAHNIKGVFVALQTYTTDHSGRLPAADRWVEDIRDYVSNAHDLHCPVNRARGRSSYAINENLSGEKLSLAKDPEHTVLVYETTSGSASPAGIGADMPAPGLHRYPRFGAKERFDFVVTVDGKLHSTVEPGSSRLHW
jgi:hypothetical protein